MQRLVQNPFRLFITCSAISRLVTGHFTLPQFPDNLNVPPPGREDGHHVVMALQNGGGHLGLGEVGSLAEPPELVALCRRQLQAAKLLGQEFFRLEPGRLVRHHRDKIDLLLGGGAAAGATCLENRI